MTLALLSYIILACGLRSLAIQPSSQPAVPAPLRELPWGQLNFLHTTDTHGWLAGHLNEQSYGADWGDYISFGEHLRNKADAEGSDLLIVDSGDRIEGNGLYDAAHPKGKYILKIFSQQDLDVLCSGNHELYKHHSSYDELEITVPEFKSHYLASNIDIFAPGSDKAVPLAPRYRKFTTQNQGIRILAFGFLFDFSMNSNNTVVQRVEDTIKETWFQEAIHDRDVDLFLVVGHVPLRTLEFPAIFKAIRDVNWDTPILFLGGHLHVRDYVKFDNSAFGMESGRFMETIGFASVSGLAKREAPASPERVQDLAKGPTFARRYIDNNLFSFHHHTGLNESTFPTQRGLNVSKQITQDRNELGLDRVIGCAPQNYWTGRAPFPGPDSIFTLLQDQVLPKKVIDNGRKQSPRLIIANTGAIRFDVFKGAFTTDSLYITSPFTSGFRSLKDVPFEKAKRLITVLNQAGSILPADQESIAFKMPSIERLESLSNDTPRHVQDQQSFLGTNALDKDLIPGYTTHDDAGSDGDDTEHSAIPTFKTPNCIEARASFPSPSDNAPEPKTVDVVYVDFIERYILLALSFLGAGVKADDTDVYMNGTTFTGALRSWISENWACET